MCYGRGGPIIDYYGDLRFDTMVWGIKNNYAKRTQNLIIRSFKLRHRDFVPPLQAKTFQEQTERAENSENTLERSLLRT
jgi:hypothetical protein